MKKFHLIIGVVVIIFVLISLNFIFFDQSDTNRQLSLVYARDAGTGGAACYDDLQCAGGEFCSYFPASCVSNNDCSSCFLPVEPFTGATCSAGYCVLPPDGNFPGGNCGSCLLDDYGTGGSSGSGNPGETCIISDPANFAKLAIKAPNNEDVAFFTELGDLAIYGNGTNSIYTGTNSTTFNDLKNNENYCDVFGGQHYYYEIKNNSGNTIAMFWYCSDEYGFGLPVSRLYIAGSEVLENYDIPDNNPIGSGNFIIHSNNFPDADSMAYFDNNGNLYLRGCVNENYDQPSGI